MKRSAAALALGAAIGNVAFAGDSTATSGPVAALATPQVIRFSYTLGIKNFGGAPLALSRGPKFLRLLATTDGSHVRIFQLEASPDREPSEYGSLQVPNWTSQVEFSPDGTSFADVGGGATLWSTQDWRRPRWRLPASESFSTLAYAPDGRTLYLAGSSAFIEALDATGGKLLWKQAALATATSRIAISPDGKIAAVGSYGGGLRLVSTADGTTLAAFGDAKSYRGKTTAAQRAGWLAHPGAVESLAFASDGARLASAGGDGTIKLWNVSKRTVIWTDICGGTTVTLAFERGGRTLDAGCGWTIRRLALLDGKIVGILRGHGGDIRAIAREADGRQLWSAAEDGTLKRWDLARRDALATYGAIDAAALSADGKTLAFARGDDAIVLRDMDEGRTLATLRGHVLPPTLGSYSYSRETVAISRDGTLVAAGGYVTEGFIDHTGVAKAVTRLWRRSSVRPLHVWNGVAPDAIAFSPNGAKLVVRSPAMSDTPDTTWSADLGSGAINAWVAQWKLYVSKTSYWPCSPDGFYDAGVRFAPTGTALVVASGDCKKLPTGDGAPLRLWPLGSRLPGAPFAGTTIGANGALALSADGATALTLDAKHVAVWDVRNRTLIASGPGLPTTTYSPRLETLAVAGRYAIALMLADPSRKGNWNQYFLYVWLLPRQTKGLIEACDLCPRRIATTASRTASERSRLLVRADGTRAYVTTPAGLDVWILEPSTAGLRSAGR